MSGKALAAGLVARHVYSMGPVASAIPLTPATTVTSKLDMDRPLGSPKDPSSPRSRLPGHPLSPRNGRSIGGLGAATLVVEFNPQAVRLARLEAGHIKTRMRG